MELTYARCEQVLNTLPIGYYTGRRIAVSLDEKEETSFYSPIEDKIVVSYPIIAHRMKQLPDTADEEEAVRSMLYHEVSHAILTPSSLNGTNINNIVEDERIETVLRNYYHNVNFRKQLYDIHGGNPPKADTAEKAFYNAVRFGLGTGKVQTALNKLLKKYASMNRTSPSYDSRNPINTYNYENDIEELYDLIRKEFKTNPEEFNSANGYGQDKNTPSTQKQNAQAQAPGKDGKEEKKEEEKENGDGEPNAIEPTEDMPEKVGDSEREIEMTAEQVKKMVGACVSPKPDLSDAECEKLADFQKTIETIIGNFNKKNSGGSGINTYSGVFNPRAVARRDYRFFERSMTTQGNNRFGTCHLNLIIDCSGSFCPNVALTNGILNVLTEIERKNRNFTIDVAFINHEFHICESVRERVMKAYGGNKIPEDMKQIMLKLQKPQTCNYNIILFDGDAMCGNWDCHSMADYRNRFKVFDMKQTTLITDPDNEQYINNDFTSTKVVVTRNYTEELVKHITHALTIAFG